MVTFFNVALTSANRLGGAQRLCRSKAAHQVATQTIDFQITPNYAQKLLQNLSEAFSHTICSSFHFGPGPKKAAADPEGD